jgi:hypothetical protein
VGAFIRAPVLAPHHAHYAPARPRAPCVLAPHHPPTCPRAPARRVQAEATAAEATAAEAATAPTATQEEGGTWRIRPVC